MRLTDEKPHVGLPVQLLFVHLAQHFSGGHHVKQTDDYPGVLPAQVFNRVGGVTDETLSGNYFDAVLLAPGFDVLNRLKIKNLVLSTHTHTHAKPNLCIVLSRFARVPVNNFYFLSTFTVCILYSI